MINRRTNLVLFWIFSVPHFLSWNSLIFSSNSFPGITPSWQVDDCMLKEAAYIINKCNQIKINLYLNLSYWWHAAWAIHLLSSVWHCFSILSLRFEKASTSLAILSLPYQLRKAILIEWSIIMIMGKSCDITFIIKTLRKPMNAGQHDSLIPIKIREINPPAFNMFT